MKYSWDEEKASCEVIECAIWDNKPYCPHCGYIFVHQMKNKEGTDRNKRFLWRCKDCKKQFTVRIGTEMQDSRLPFTVWVCAILEAKNPFQLHRLTGISYKSAYYLWKTIKWPELHITLKKLTKEGKIKRLSYSKWIHKKNIGI